VLSRAALEASAQATLARLGASSGDRWLCCVPLHRIAGLQIVVRSRLLGTPPVIHPRFDPHAIAAEDDVTLVSIVPTMLARLLDAGVDLRRFRAVLVGGGPAPPGLLDRAHAAGVPLVASYGMTETSGGCVYDGVPLDGVDVRLAADGRILIRGPVLCSGYRDGPALQDGWLHTADVGAWDPGGRLRVLGRTDTTIITGGEKVDPAEVADVLRAHPAVDEVAVFGRPDPDWGERVVARVVTDGEPPTLDVLRDWVRARLAAYKAPTELEVTPPG
jgi:o-succinylbenzoate---CoA ligase